LGSGAQAVVAQHDFVWPASGKIWQNAAEHSTIENRHAQDITNLGNDVPVVAAYDGVVEASFNNSGGTCTIDGHTYPGGFGQVVVLRHDEGTKTYWSLYGHLASRAVSKDDVVAQGEDVGVMGSTGCSSGPHVHFEIGTCVDGSGLIQAGSCSIWLANDPPPYVTQVKQGDLSGGSYPGLSTDDAPKLSSTLARSGRALTTGDFDGDGYGDVVVGAPGENIHETKNAGAITVTYGSASGLTGGRTAQLYSGSGIAGVAEANDYLGSAVASGDFDKDGYSDVAIGAPGEDISTAFSNAGAITVVYGSASGLSGARTAQFYSEHGLAGKAEANDYLGSSLSSGDFDNDGYGDLAIGVPGEDLRDDLLNGGAVTLLYGSTGGLSGARSAQFYSSSGIAGKGEASDYLGSALASGDFDHDGFADVAIGVPGEDIRDDALNAGAITVLYGSAGGLAAARSAQFYSESGIAGKAEENDSLGGALTSGDYDKDGYSDLAIGAPGENVGNGKNEGAITIVYGSASGLSGARSAQLYSGSGIAGLAEASDYLGSAVASGDYDNDGYGDVSIGTPREDAGPTDAGAITVVYGSAGGLTGARSAQLYSEHGIAGRAETSDYLGSSVASGDFDNDGYVDLAVGVPGEDISTDVPNAGAITLLYGSAGGLSGTRTAQFYSGNGLAGNAEVNDYAGGSIYIDAGTR
jgi:hypothetical protein